RAAVVEVHADPVPADRVGAEKRIAPLMVEPGGAGDRDRLAAVEREQATHRKLRLAVVEAELRGVGPLARDAALALQQHRLRRGELEVEAKARAVARRTRAVTARPVRALAGEAPVAKDQARVGLGSGGDAEAAAREALVGAQ